MKSLGNIPLVSTGRMNGASYTDAERTLALSVSQVVLTAVGIRQYDISSLIEVITVLELVQEEGNCNCVPAYCRTVYKKIEATRLADNSTLKDFPKIKEGERLPRDYTSVGLLLRHAFEECGFNEEEVQKVFPKYKRKIN